MANKLFEHKRCLTIDDSATIRTLLVNHLSKEGAIVEEASDGVTALEMLATQPSYDLVLIDLLLPDLNGIEILKKIREQNTEAAIMMLTGVGGVKSAMMAGQIGADGYFEKQDLAGSGFVEFFYAAQQAFERRAGLIAHKQLAQLKIDFYSMMAHDLRSPLTALLISAEMLTEQSANLSPEQRELLALQHHTMQNLLQWVDDYLDFAKIDAGYLKIETSRTDFTALIKESIRLARLQANVRCQEVILELPTTPLEVSLDSKKMQQVIENLISNAIKYTPEGGRITIRLNAAHHWAELQVSDTGKGIPAHELPALFAKYHRVPDEPNKRIKGMGLGLLIVKEIVQAHNGEVSAHSAGVGQGTTFTVRLPM